MAKTAKATLGILALVPAAVLVGAGVMGLGRPDWLVHPVLVMGGLGLALAINAWGALAVRGQRSGGALSGTLEVRYAGRAANLAVVAVGAALLGAIMLYLVLENAAPR